MTSQLFLFEDPADVAEREAEETTRRDAERLRQPHTCPCCGTTEPNAYLLSINHGFDLLRGTIYGFPVGQHPIYGKRCTKQTLIDSHIRYATVRGLSDLLEECASTGRRIGLDVDAIIADARARAEASQR